MFRPNKLSFCTSQEQLSYLFCHVNQTVQCDLSTELFTSPQNVMDKDNYTSLTITVMVRRELPSDRFPSHIPSGFCCFGQPRKDLICADKSA